MAFFADLGRFPEAVILPSWPVGGVWLRDYLLCFATCTPTTLPSFSTATACRSKEFSSSTALQSTRIRGRGGGEGGLTARRKRKSSLLRPPPLFFLKVGRKRGGRNSGAVRYISVLVIQSPTQTTQQRRLTFDRHCSLRQSMHKTKQNTGGNVNYKSTDEAATAPVILFTCYHEYQPTKNFPLRVLCFFIVQHEQIQITVENKHR